MNHSRHKSPPSPSPTILFVLINCFFFFHFIIKISFPRSPRERAVNYMQDGGAVWGEDLCKIIVTERPGQQERREKERERERVWN